MRFLKNFLLVLISLAVTVVIIDIGLKQTRLSSLIKKDFYPQGYFQADPVLGFDIVPNHKKTKHVFFDAAYDIWSNKIGCYDEDPLIEGSYIYLTGDSFAWGFAPFASKWGTIMDNALGIRILKCGVGGYGTQQEFIKTRRDLERLPAPATIIVGYLGANDVEDDAEFPNSTVYNGYLVENLAKDGVTEEEAKRKYELFDTYCMTSEPVNRFVQRMKCVLDNNSVVYNLLKNNVRKVLMALLPEGVLTSLNLVVKSAASSAVEDLSTKETYGNHQKSVLEFKMLAEQHGSKLLFVLIPSRDEIRGFSAPTYNEKMKVFLDKHKIAYVDLLPELKRYEIMPQRPLYWTVDGHWNEMGNRIAGFLVSMHLLDHGFATTSVARTVNIEEYLREALPR